MTSSEPIPCSMSICPTGCVVLSPPPPPPERQPRQSLGIPMMRTALVLGLVLLWGVPARAQIAQELELLEAFGGAGIPDIQASDREPSGAGTGTALRLR